jgi:hypothetical protein
MYGRYAHENSLAFKEGFLNLPLINIWLEDFKNSTKKEISTLNLSIFNFHLSTYLRYDEAFAFKNKELSKIGRLCQIFSER